MPPITRGQTEANSSVAASKNKKNSNDKKRQVKKSGGGHGGRDDDSVDSRGNLRGFIDYDESDQEVAVVSKEKRRQQVSNRNNMKKFGGGKQQNDSEDDEVPNFEKYSNKKNQVVKPFTLNTNSKTSKLGMSKKTNGAPTGGLSRLKKFADLKKNKKKKYQQ